MIFGGFELPCPQQQQPVSNTAACGGLVVQNEFPSQGGPPQGAPGPLWSLARQSQSLLQRSSAHHGIHLLKVKVRACLAAAQHTSITAVMASFCSWWSRTSCDVYHHFPVPPTALACPQSRACAPLSGPAGRWCNHLDLVPLTQKCGAWGAPGTLNCEEVGAHWSNS